MHEEAKALFDSGMSLADIAKKFDIPAGTVRGWKSKEHWNAGTSERSAAKPARVTKPKPGTAPFKPKNQDAVIHGLFARYLPGETRDIVDQMQDRKPIDILYDQIQLAYAAILRAQQLMYVRDQQDITTTKVGESDGLTSSEKWEVQLPWDKHASFLNAQDKAQASLNNMIKQYEEMSHYELAAEEQRARIDQIKAATDKMTGTVDPEAGNQQALAIADLINNSVSERKLEDFMNKEAVTDDTVCASDSEAD